MPEEFLTNEDIRSFEAEVLAGETDALLIEKIPKLAELIFANYDFAKAFRLSKGIEVILQRLVAQTSADTVKNIEDILVKLKFLSLAFLSVPVITSLFEDGLGKVLGYEYIDIEDRLIAALISIPDVNDRDALKRQLLQSMKNNKEVLASGVITTEEGTKIASIGNIVRDYLDYAGDQVLGTMGLARYISGSKWFASIGVDEKSKVRQLLELFNMISIPSSVPQGYENIVGFVDSDGSFKIIDHGRIEVTNIFIDKKSVSEISDEENKVSKNLPDSSDVIKVKEASDKEQSIVSAYQGDTKQQRVVIKEVEKLQKSIGSDSKKLVQEFYKAVQGTNVNRTVAILQEMARQETLLEFLVQDKRLHTFMSATWKKQYGSSLVDEFRQDPTQPKFVRLFLQYILEQRLSMTVTNAAHAAMQIGNILVSSGKKGYNKMAYFDIESQSFKWFD